MKVREVIDKLSHYNGNAEFCIVVNGRTKPFEICYGNSEGCTPQNCQCVDFMIDTESERTK